MEKTLQELIEQAESAETVAEGLEYQALVGRRSKKYAAYWRDLATARRALVRERIEATEIEMGARIAAKILERGVVANLKTEETD